MYTASNFSSSPAPASAPVDISSAAAPPRQRSQGVSAYARMGTQGAAMAATPHQLICMLFDGVRTALLMARHHMAEGNTVAKGNALSKAINIIDNGLKASLDGNAGGAQGAALAGQLASLYDYVVARLMLANRRNDPTLIDEADRLLDNVGSAWREIGQPAGSQS